jgi:hypothetical protein
MFRCGMTEQAQRYVYRWATVNNAEARTSAGEDLCDIAVPMPPKDGQGRELNYRRAMTARRGHPRRGERDRRSVGNQAGRAVPADKCGGTGNAKTSAR